VSQWVGVHGIGQQYCSREEILKEWIPALSGGVEWATGRRVQPDLDLAFYGHLFRRAEPPRTGTQTGKGTVSGDAAADLADLDEAELADLSGAVEEIVGAGEMAAAAAMPPKAAIWLPVPAQNLIGAVERRFPASGVLLLGTLRQVRGYLRDPQLKSEADLITARAAAGAAVLIGHSLGSVVAYEFLRQNPGHSVRLLLTVGSPLGLKMVRDRLPAGDPGAVRWVNVRDPNDPVTAAGALGRWYPQAEDGYADNGLQAHDAKRYLNCKATGAALADFLPEPSP
jgi:hypothetical protein